MTTQALSAATMAKLPGPGPFVHAALEAIRDRHALAWVTVPAPLAPLEALLEAGPGEDALLWQPSEGPSFSAIGAVETLTGAGATRTAQIRNGAESIWPRLSTATLGDAPPAPRFFGGFSFQPGWAAAEPWARFGDARFVLPRFRYARDGDRAWLSVAARADEAASETRRRSLVGTLEGLLAALRTASTRTPSLATPARARVVTRREEASEEEWRSLVRAVLARIASGDFEKVVIAGRTALSFDAPVDVLDVLAELAGSAEHCTRFALRFDDVAFLGATPERLVRRAGATIDTEALAGSNRVGDAARATEMMESPKEREEHELVVREILRSLAPVCASLEHPEAPEVRVLRHLIHLTTPIRGRLALPVHVLDLVATLHPTPAVGGVPAGEAVRFITDHEPAERGWYASPVGWFDAHGDGEFVVALRSGAFVGNRAYLYAGGGIVRDSDPASEYAETRLKLAALCAALRVAQ
jgi:menaquinone-specific isochorismate synthase